MSLVRAFTKRSKRSDKSPSAPVRADSTKKNGQAVNRNKISSPIALISTTNMLSYNAPDIASIRQVSSSAASTTSSSSSAEDSDSSLVSNQTGNETDASSVSSGSGSPVSPKPNHLSCYFPSPARAPRRSVSTVNFSRKSDLLEDVPAIPKRALSHSKKAHEQIARKRSLNAVSMHSSSNSREHRTSVDMFRGSVVDPSHPFGKELEQLNEVAEEFGAVAISSETEMDLFSMQQYGLSKFCASEYLMEIQPLYTNIFGDELSVGMAWI